ncbi:hypothetical protein SEVIR_5G347601v4 [Setaria viridis]
MGRGRNGPPPRGGRRSCSARAAAPRRGRGWARRLDASSTCDALVQNIKRLHVEARLVEVDQIRCCGRQGRYPGKSGCSQQCNLHCVLDQVNFTCSGSKENI